MSEGLVSRLLARLDDLEAAANEALTTRGLGMSSTYPARWRAKPMSGANVGGRTHEVGAEGRVPVAEGLVSAVADFFADHDPESVLRLCRAHRDLIELHARAHECGEVKTGVYPPDWPADAPYGAPGEPWRHVSSEYFEVEPCPSLRALARGLGVEETTDGRA